MILFSVVKEQDRRQGRLVIHGGADRDRTDDLLVANQTLSQLSYSPIASAARRRPTSRGPKWS